MKRHAFDTVSFVFGVILLGIGLTGVFADEDITYLEARWVWPALLVAAGVGVMAFTIGKGDRRESSDAEVYDPVD